MIDAIDDLIAQGQMTLQKLKVVADSEVMVRGPERGFYGKIDPLRLDANNDDKFQISEVREGLRTAIGSRDSKALNTIFHLMRNCSEPAGAFRVPETGLEQTLTNLGKSVEDYRKLMNGIFDDSSYTEEKRAELENKIEREFAAAADLYANAKTEARRRVLRQGIEYRLRQLSVPLEPSMLKKFGPIMGAFLLVFWFCLGIFGAVRILSEDSWKSDAKQKHDDFAKRIDALTLNKGVPAPTEHDWCLQP